MEGLKYWRKGKGNEKGGVNTSWLSNQYAFIFADLIDQFDE
jgi:hypothetical protein